MSIQKPVDDDKTHTQHLLTSLNNCIKNKKSGWLKYLNTNNTDFINYFCTDSTIPSSIQPKPPYITHRYFCSTKNKTLRDICYKASIQPSCKTMKYFRFDNNSCYFNDTIMALLYTNNKFIDDNILYVDLDTLKIEAGNNKEDLLKNYNSLYQITKNIQNELLSLKRTITSDAYTLYCTNIRNMFAKYDEEYRLQNWSLEKINWYDILYKDEYDQMTNQLSPPAVIRRLNFIFNVKDDGTYTTNTTLRNTINKPVTSIKYNNTRKINIIYPIKLSEYKSQKNIDIMNMLSSTIISKSCDFKHKNKCYNERTTTDSLNPSDILYIDLDRIYAYYDKDRGYKSYKLGNNVTAPYTINSKNHKLYLTAVFCHDSGTFGGHYTVYLKCDDGWYRYDDLLSKFEFYSKKIWTNYIKPACTGFLYFRK